MQCVSHLFRLLDACGARANDLCVLSYLCTVLTGRSWDTITASSSAKASSASSLASFTPALGVSRALDADELDNVALNAGQYFVEIASVLATVPRPLLLVFKTNDLLRSVARSLGLAEWASMAVMSKAVLDVCRGESGKREEGDGEPWEEEDVGVARSWIEWVAVKVVLWLYEVGVL